MAVWTLTPKRLNAWIKNLERDGKIVGKMNLWRYADPSKQTDCPWWIKAHEADEKFTELEAEVERLNAAIEGALEQRDWQIEKVDGYKRQADRHRGKIKTLEAELAEAYGLLEEVVLWTYDVNNELIGRRGHPGIPGWLRLLSILAKRKGAE